MVATDTASLMIATDTASLIVATNTTSLMVATDTASLVVATDTASLMLATYTASLKATVENPRGTVEKLSPKESVKGADTVLSGSVRTLKMFSEGKPKAAKPRGRSPQSFSAEGLPKGLPSHCPAAQCWHPRHSPEGAVIPLCPKDFQKLLRLLIS